MAIFRLHRARMALNAYSDVLVLPRVALCVQVCRCQTCGWNTCAPSCARVEHPFRVKFGFQKVRYRGLAKNGAQLSALFALANLWMVRRRWLAMPG